MQGASFANISWISYKPKKPAGFDRVSNIMIRKISLGYVDCLVKRYNMWLNRCRYPDE
jgi:hypothetical protein